MMGPELQTNVSVAGCCIPPVQFVNFVQTLVRVCPTVVAVQGEGETVLVQSAAVHVVGATTVGVQVTVSVLGWETPPEQLVNFVHVTVCVYGGTDGQMNGEFVPRQSALVQVGLAVKGFVYSQSFGPPVIIAFISIISEIDKFDDG